MTDAWQWTPWSFRRRGKAFSVNITTEVAMPLGQRGVVMRAELSNRGAHAVSFTLEVLPQVRNYAAVNCSPQQWRFPSNEAQHCWNWFAPRTFANESAAFSATFDPKRRLAVFYDHTTGADGAPPAVTAIAFAGEWGALKFNVSSQRGRPLVASFSVPPKAQRDAAAMEQPMTVGLALAVGVVSELPTLITTACDSAASLDGQIDGRARAERQARFQAAFTPNNTVFSGHLPRLELSADAMATDSGLALHRHYYGAVLQALDLERLDLQAAPTSTTPLVKAPRSSSGPGTARASVPPPRATRRVWITGGGSNTSTNTFFWDLDFAPTLLALLDPSGLRASLLLFLAPSLGGLDARAGWGVDWMTGHRVGAWYAANDFSLYHLCRTYVAVSNDVSFLNETVASDIRDTSPERGEGVDREARVKAAGTVQVSDVMLRLATAWQNRSSAGCHGLADYGHAHNLLEAVPTYVHCVAGFNAANVWMMRDAAAITEATGGAKRAAALRRAATTLGAAVIGLYQNGAGVFKAQYPNGSSAVVRHVVDFVYTLRWLGDDTALLNASVRSEMAHFAKQELLTRHWMRALSLQDAAAKQSDRTDHGPNGAYSGWVPLTIAGLADAGDFVAAAALLNASARALSLGPFGQALSVSPSNRSLLHQQATVPYKPFEFTLFNAWCGFGFADTIVGTIFGLRADLAPLLAKAAAPPITAPKARREVPAVGEATLRGVLWRGETWMATLKAGGAPQWSRESSRIRLKR